MKRQVKERAMRTFKLSMARAKHHCPPWARSLSFRARFLKVYQKAAIKNWYRFAYGKSGEFYQVDHIIPLHGEKVSGLHVPWNLKVIPAIINMAKGTLIVEEYGLRHEDAKDTRPWGGGFSVSNSKSKTNKWFSERRVDV